MKKRWFWVGIWAFVVLLLSILPTALMPANRENVLWELSADKIGHVVVYAVLAGLIVRACVGWSPGRRCIAAVLSATSYGILMEGIQYGMVSSRYFEVDDIIANIIGSLCGSLLTVFFMLKNDNV